MYCVQNQSSDISLQTDRPAVGEIHGYLYPLTARPLDPADMNVIMTKNLWCGRRGQAGRR